MRIVIIGAGELGKYLASTLSSDKHDIVLIDQNDEILEKIKERMDVMIVEGNGAGIHVLKRASVQDSDVLIAVSGDEATNVLACQIARHMGLQNTICRLNSGAFFSEEDRFLPETMNLDKIVVPSEECIDKITNILDNKIVIEKILFSNPNALMTAFEVQPSCPLAGIRIRDFPLPDMINNIRFAAILRDRQHLIPHGDTIFVPGDKVYLAGPRDKVDAMVEWTSPQDSKISRVIIAGATKIGKGLARKLCENGKFEVRVIEADQKAGEKLLDELGASLMVINGEPSETEVMTEAGVDVCHAFISALDDDEDNILSCILAKKLGARKVITVTKKSEYIDIVPAMELIDSGFSASLVSINTILRYLGSGIGALRIDAILHRINAYVFEFNVEPGSPSAGKQIDSLKFPLSVVLAMVFRNGEVLPASGSLKLHENDKVVTVTTHKTAKIIEPLFLKKGFFPV